MIALVVLIASLADLMTFICAQTVIPIQGESNPIARVVYGGYGVPGVILFKTAGTLIAALILQSAEPTLLRNIAIGICIVVPLFGAFTNTLAVVVSK